MDSEIRQLAGVMRKESFKEDDQIIKYGDIGSKYYILLSGKVKVTVYKQGTDPTDPNIEHQI